MNPSKPFVWWALIGALLVSTTVAATSVTSKRKAMADATARLAEVQQERDRLTQELSSIRQSMTDQAGRLASLQEELTRAEKEVTRLRLDYARLQGSNTTLSTELSDAVRTKTALEATLSSVRGLKMAIHELRSRQWRSFWAGTWQRWAARAKAQRALDTQQLVHGNRGLLVRNGLPTTSPRATLQVRVLDPQSE